MRGILVLLVLASSVFGQNVKIDIKNRVDNQQFEDGYCAWASLETLARHHGIVKLNNLVKERSEEPKYVWVKISENNYIKVLKNVGHEWAIYRKLLSLGVKFRMAFEEDAIQRLIKYSMDNKLGCIFVVSAGWDGRDSGETHALILVDWNDKEIKYVDTNRIKENYFTRTRSWFDKWRTSYIIVLEK